MTSGREGTGRVMLLRVRGSPPAPRTLFASPGAIGEVAFSPDGTTVLASRPGVGEWVMLPVEKGRAHAIGGIARHFDPRRERPRGMPAVSVAGRPVVTAREARDDATPATNTTITHMDGITPDTGAGWPPVPRGGRAHIRHP